MRRGTKILNLWRQNFACHEKLSSGKISLRCFHSGKHSCVLQEIQKLNSTNTELRRQIRELTQTKGQLTELLSQHTHLSSGACLYQDVATIQAAEARTTSSVVVSASASHVNGTVTSGCASVPSTSFVSSSSSDVTQPIATTSSCHPIISINFDELLSLLDGISELEAGYTISSSALSSSL